jgi:hypothetical protein
MNPTVRNYIQIIENLENVVVIDYFNFENIKRPHPESLIIFLPFALLGKTSDHFKRAYSRLQKAYYIPKKKSINYDLASRYYNVFKEIYSRSKSSIALLLEYDLHALLEDDLMLHYIKRESDYLLLAGPELYDTNYHRHQKPDIDMVKFNRGFEFLEVNKRRIISMSHFVDLSEFSNIDSLYYKNRFFSSPGAKYLNRKIFISQYLTSVKSDYFRSTLDTFIVKILWQLPFQSFKIQFGKFYFTKIIKNSFFAYTCGSTAGFFVRKFLEIPINGTCMITHNYEFLKSLGLIDGEHFLNLDDIETQEILANAKILDCQNIRVKEIINNSRKFIFKKHSTAAYVGYLDSTFKRIQKNEFCGSYWQAGEYKFH